MTDENPCLADVFKAFPFLPGNLQQIGSILCSYQFKPFEIVYVVYFHIAEMRKKGINKRKAMNDLLDEASDKSRIEALKAKAKQSALSLADWLATLEELKASDAEHSLDLYALVYKNSVQQGDRKLTFENLELSRKELQNSPEEPSSSSSWDYK